MNSSEHRPIRIGLIGAGQRGQNHLETYQQIPGAEIVAIADINETLTQRVAAEYHLPGMSARSVAAYIDHRLRVAGAAREIFTPAACECVHLASRGIPRLVNQICDYALVYAFTDGLDKVDAGVIEQVVTDRRTHGNLKMTAG